MKHSLSALRNRAQQALHRASAAASRMADALWYGHPTPMHPPAHARGQVWAVGLQGPALLAFHQWQHDGTQSTPNDCATVCVAMAVNIALRLHADGKSAPLRHATLARLLDRAPLHAWRLFRIPFVGAMPPGRTAAALNYLASRQRVAGENRPWQARTSSKNTLDDLFSTLVAGKLSILFGVWEDGTPHAMLLAGYDAPRDTWRILDPGLPPQEGTGKPLFRRMNSDQLHAWWGRRCPWYPRYTMVTLNARPAT
jgi:hypothetical protein